ncbi:MAG: hypothetical protein HYV48_03205, partial [Candidatus Omnitrophica bacterium]|nr:hypothetical protein [Candidatus Omnitrophota bacterium]
LTQMSNGVINKNISNIWFKDGKEIIRNGIGPMITDLDKLPFVDRAIYRIGEGDNQYLEIMGSR